MSVEGKPDIEAVLEYYAKLEGREFDLGRAMSGKVKIHCPFHDDRHPSASLNLTTERFYCYACSVEGGDSIDVIKGQEGIGFNAAKQWAADHLGWQDSDVCESPAAGRYRPSFGTDEDD